MRVQASLTSQRRLTGTNILRRKRTKLKLLNEGSREKDQKSRDAAVISLLPLESHQLYEFLK